MVFPSTAKSLGETMDPQEVLDYSIDVSGLLEQGETVVLPNGWDVTLLSEAVAAGLLIKSDPGFEPVYDPAELTINLWFEIDPSMQNDTSFRNGVTCPMEVTIETSQSRVRQRTTTLTVIQK